MKLCKRAGAWQATACGLLTSHLQVGGAEFAPLLVLLVLLLQCACTCAAQQGCAGSRRHAAAIDVLLLDQPRSALLGVRRLIKAYDSGSTCHRRAAGAGAEELKRRIAGGAHRAVRAHEIMQPALTTPTIIKIVPRM